MSYLKLSDSPDSVYCVAFVQNGWLEGLVRADADCITAVQGFASTCRNNVRSASDYCMRSLHSLDHPLFLQRIPDLMVECVTS